MSNEAGGSEKKPSRQRLWQAKRLAEGCCVRCGKPRNLYKHRCDDCQAVETLRTREKNRCNAWKAGGRGRKPKTEEGGA